MIEIYCHVSIPPRGAQKPWIWSPWFTRYAGACNACYSCVKWLYDRIFMFSSPQHPWSTDLWVLLKCNVALYIVDLPGKRFNIFSKRSLLILKNTNYIVFASKVIDQIHRFLFLLPPCCCTARPRTDVWIISLFRVRFFHYFSVLNFTQVYLNRALWYFYSFRSFSLSFGHPSRDLYSHPC